jgi:hypothetical protein
MKTYLFYAGGAAVLILLLSLFIAWRRARKTITKESRRRLQLERVVRDRLVEQGSPRFLDFLQAYYEQDRSEIFYPYYPPNYHLLRDERILFRRHRLPGMAADRSLDKRETIAKSGPKTFYYLDETQVRDLYPQVFREPEPKQIEKEERGTSTHGAKAKLKFLEGKLEGQTEERTRTRYEPEITPAIMYNRVEEYFFETPDVSFEVEEFQHDTDSIEAFRSMCRMMEDKFHFPVPSDLQQKFISDRMRTLALAAIDTLSSTSGYVVLQAEFSVSTASTEECILRLPHPLNEYLGTADTKAHIDIFCNPTFLTPAGKAAFTAGSSVKIACLGKVIRWDSERFALVINPIAIY